MTTSTSTNFHADARTSVERNLPTPTTLGGWVKLGEFPNELTIFPPYDPTEAQDFWRYLSNVAADMVGYVDMAQREGLK